MATRKVLLTGATGFLGGELLVRLLAEEPRRIVCLVRAPSRDAARARGAAALAALTGAPELAGLVEWLPGDLSRPRLGQSRAGWARLAGQLDEVFHCAGDARLDLSLAEGQRVHVQGAIELVRLCAEAQARGGLRRLNHVSSAWVAGRAGPAEVDADALPRDRPELFRNAWERTQARAERLLRARWRELPITIYRPSFLAGESETGRSSPASAVARLIRLLAAGALPFLPGGGAAGDAARLDCVPVDHAAAGILALARRDDTRGRAFHLVAGAQAPSLARLIEEVGAGLARRAHARLPARVVGPLPWALLRALLPRLHPATAAHLAQLAPFESYTGQGPRFRDQRERVLLGAAGVTLPAPGLFLPRVIDPVLPREARAC